MPQGLELIRPGWRWEFETQHHRHSIGSHSSGQELHGEENEVRREEVMPQ